MSRFKDFILPARRTAFAVFCGEVNARSPEPVKWFVRYLACQ